MADNPSYDPRTYRDFEHAAWEKVPHTYDEKFGFLTAKAAEPLLDAVEAATGVRLLEVACGTGNVSKAAAALGAIPIGIDFVVGMVEEAQKLHPGLEFREGDSEALQFADESFDAVVCNFGVHHFPRPERAIAEAFRVLALGGRYAFTVWRPPDKVNVNFRQVIREAIETHGDPHAPLPAGPPETFFGEPKNYVKALGAVGFVDISVTEIPILGRWQDPRQVLETIYQGMARSRALIEAHTDETRVKIENAIIDRAKTFEKDGVIQIPMPATLARARKPQ